MTTLFIVFSVIETVSPKTADRLWNWLLAKAPKSFLRRIAPHIKQGPDAS